MIKTLSRPGAAPPSRKKARDQLSHLPEQASAQCADGELRPTWKWDGRRVLRLIPPGTPIVPCPSCGARVCSIPSGQSVATLDHARGAGDETNDFYAPEHQEFC